MEASAWGDCIFELPSACWSSSRITTRRSCRKGAPGLNASCSVSLTASRTAATALSSQVNSKKHFNFCEKRRWGTPLCQMRQLRTSRSLQRSLDTIWPKIDHSRLFSARHLKPKTMSTCAPAPAHRRKVIVRIKRKLSSPPSGCLQKWEALRLHPSWWPGATAVEVWHLPSFLFYA